MAVSRQSESVRQDLMLRACWYSYVEDLTQREIAALLGLSRIKVHRLLQKAKAGGFVEVRIRSPLQSCLDLGQRLRTRYGLQSAHVVPTPQNVAHLKAHLARGAADVLSRELPSWRILAVGWGSTLAEIVLALAGARAPHLQVVSTVGGIGAGSGAHPYEVVLRLAEVLGARAAYLAAPAYADSAAARDLLIAQEHLRPTLQAAQSAEALLVGIGEITRTATLVSQGLVKAAELNALRRAGAVGSLLLYFYDQHGRLVSTAFHERAVGLPTDALLRIPTRMGVAGGPHKVEPLRAALRGGWINALVVDESTAVALLEDATPRRRR